MTYIATKTRTWSRVTPADGDLIDDEIDRLYDNVIYLKSALDSAINKQIPLGASRIEDDFDKLTPENGFVLSNAQAVLRSDVDAGLLSDLIKAVISINAGTDRINIPAHGLLDGRAVKFDFTLAGITAGTKYFIRNKTTDDFQLSLYPSGSILDLTADATGNMMTNVSWGFGNGSTTINVPDERALFGRGAGVHGTLLKANGSYYDGGAVGESFPDQIIAHWHEGWKNTGAGAQSGFGADATNNGGAVINTAENIKNVKSDGVTGTPNTGDENTPVSSSHNLKTRIR